MTLDEETLSPGIRVLKLAQDVLWPGVRYHWGCLGPDFRVDYIMERLTLNGKTLFTRAELDDGLMKEFIPRATSILGPSKAGWEKKRHHESTEGHDE